MAVIAEPVAKPVSRFHFILDRRDVLEALLVAPAIIYVLLLVGLPLLLAVYYSVSAYTIYDPTWKFVGLANFADIIENPTFPQTLVNTFIFTFGSQLLGLVLGKFGAFLLLRPFPGRKFVRALIILPFVGAGRARHHCLAMDVRFALQRDQLDADRARHHRPATTRRTGSAIRTWRCCA